METRDKLLRKIYRKDYTNRLEKILEKKSFSMDTKNLLLSMFYKLENAYKDYETTKVEVATRNEFLENLLNKIDVECEEIMLGNFQSAWQKLLQEKQVDFIIDKDKKRIIAIANEMLVLECILTLTEQEISFPEEEKALKVPLNKLLNIGNRINQVEVIRDFNGWSWDISSKNISNFTYNIIFQTLTYLLGYSFLEQWINNNTGLADYLMLAYDNLTQNFGEKRASRIITLVCKLSIDVENKQNEEQAKKWITLKEEVRARSRKVK